VIDGWLRADLDAPRKQRHTATRIHARLLDEHGAGDVSYAAVRDYVARRRPEIRIEEGRGPAKVFVPQHHPPGLEAEVDFGELWVRLAGTLVKFYLFAFRMSYSGKAVHLVSATCGQEAFLEGHVHAFTVLGGVPAGQIWYDNLTPAVTKVLRKGRARIENPRWTAFLSQSHGLPQSPAADRGTHPAVRSGPRAAPRAPEPDSHLRRPHRYARSHAAAVDADAPASNRGVHEPILIFRGSCPAQGITVALCLI